MPAALELTHLLVSYRVDAGKPFTLGRDPENDLVIALDTVSGRHARIVGMENGFAVEDLDSCNGTRVAGAEGVWRSAAAGPVPLADTGVIELAGRDGVRIDYRIVPAKAAAFGGETGARGRAEALMTAGRFDEAAAVLEPLLGNRFAAPGVYYDAGYCAYRQGDREQAVLRYEQYLALQPEDGDVLVDLAGLYGDLGRLDEARRCCRRVLQDRPGDSAAVRVMRKVERLAAGPLGASKDRCTREIVGSSEPVIWSQPPFIFTFDPVDHSRILNDVLKALVLAGDELSAAVGWRPPPDEPVPVRLVRSLGQDRGRTDATGITLRLAAGRSHDGVFVFTAAAHEYAHWAMGCLAGFGDNVPWWLQEGFAQEMSQTLTADRLVSIRAFLGAGAPGLLDDLSRNVMRRFGGRGRKALNAAYVVAQAAVHQLMADCGRERFHRLLASLRDGRPIRRAFEAAGMDYGGAEAQLLRWLREGRARDGCRLTRSLE